MTSPQLASLALLLLVALHQDLLHHRIPNALTLGGALGGIALAAIQGGANGALLAGAGLAVGLAALLPFHLLKGMGAGDVKLMAAVGSFVGPYTAGLAAAFTLVAGALIAVGWLIAARFAPRDRLDSLLAPGAGSAAASAAARRPSSRATERFPYAIAIVLGTLAALAATGALPTVTLAAVLHGAGS